MAWHGLFRVFFLLIVLSFFGCASSQSAGSLAELPTSSDQTSNQKRANIRLQLAVGYYQQHQLEVALDEVKQALVADPDFADAYSMRALIYMEMDQMPLAEENFLRAIKLAPNSPDLSNNYGWFLCQSGRENQSISYFEAALKSRSYQSPAKALHNAGVCSLKLNEQNAAEKYFLQAFKIEPDNLSVTVNLASIYFNHGDYERSRFYISRAIKADMLTTEVLWLAIKVEHKLGDRAAESSLATQLRRRYVDSPEYAAYKRGAYDE
ncbi:MAG: type IV pilus biogenesis/stability protein PilW [Glaciimonas sp.]|nr:type IV pilus biogenesis/stability protein PilW [Glaciimonas sp.]